jgi:hypothetical protein
VKLKDRLDILDEKLSYNFLYAPEYPVEDQTNLKKEMSEMKSVVLDIEPNIRTDDKKMWIRLIRENIESSEKEFFAGNSVKGRKHLDEAIRYLQNIKLNIKAKPAFVSGTNGTIKKGHQT